MRRINAPKEMKTEELHCPAHTHLMVTRQRKALSSCYPVAYIDFIYYVYSCIRICGFMNNFPFFASRFYRFSVSVPNAAEYKTFSFRTTAAPAATIKSILFSSGSMQSTKRIHALSITYMAAVRGTRHNRNRQHRPAAPTGSNWMK